MGILLLRRLPMMLALRPLIDPLRSRVDALFAGWFGPMGVAALFYATLAERKAGLEEAWVVGSLVVFASTIAHGVTATPLTKWYGRREGPEGDDEADQQHSEDAPQQPPPQRDAAQHG